MLVPETSYSDSHWSVLFDESDVSGACELAGEVATSVERLECGVGASFGVDSWTTSVYAGDGCSVCTEVLGLCGAVSVEVSVKTSLVAWVGVVLGMLWRF